MMKTPYHTMTDVGTSYGQRCNVERKKEDTMRLESPNYRKIQRFCHADKGWGTAYPGPVVKLTCATNLVQHDGNVLHRVYVWDASDDGMKLEFRGADKQADAEAMYETVSVLPLVTKEALRKLGFVPD